MKTVLAITGALAIFAVGTLAILFVIGLNAIKPLTAEATAFADESIPDIVADWDGEALRRRASLELLAELPDETLLGLMQFGVQNLGALKDYQGASCVIVSFQMKTDEGELVQASCDARAEHESGGAGYSLALLKRNDSWSLLSFFVIPDEIRDTDDRARMVIHQGGALNAVTVSFKAGSIGLTSKRPLTAGAGVYGYEKIENIQ